MLGREIEGLAVNELLSSFRQILHELRRRGLIRTLNAPTGDYAEFLVGRYFGVDLLGNSHRSADLVTKDGIRVQVKARIVTGAGKGERQLSVIRSWEFDRLAVVLFDDNYVVHRAALIPVDLVRDRSRDAPYVRGAIVFATDALFDAPGVEDMTSDLRRVAADL